MRGVGHASVATRVGIVVAVVYDYFSNLETAGKILTAITAVVMWPFLLFGFDINIQRNAD